jgi:hypothetical protein
LVFIPQLVEQIKNADWRTVRDNFQQVYHGVKNFITDSSRNIINRAEVAFWKDRELYDVTPDYIRSLPVRQKSEEDRLYEMWEHLHPDEPIPMDLDVIKEELRGYKRRYYFD